MTMFYWPNLQFTKCIILSVTVVFFIDKSKYVLLCTVVVILGSADLTHLCVLKISVTCSF